MADADEKKNERKKRLANLKRELQNKAKRKRKQLLQGTNIRKTSVDRSLEKSFLTKSELSVANSFARRQMILSLNLNLARQVQQLKESGRELQDKLNGSEINFCELAFKHNGQKCIIESLELEVERLKAKCDYYESWKKSAVKKLNDMFTVFNDSRVVSDRESVLQQDLDLEKNLQDDFENSSRKSKENCQEIVNTENVDDKRSLQLGKTDFRALFDMTAITEEGGFTPNVTMNENFIDNFEVTHISSSDEEEVLEEEVRKSRRATFIVTKSLQIEAMPTPVKSKNVRRSEYFSSTLKISASSGTYLSPNLSEESSAAIDLNKTKLDAEDLEPTAALNKSAKKVIEQTSTKCVQNESSIHCSTNFIDCLTIASAKPTSLPSLTPRSTNKDHDLNCYNPRPTFDWSESRSLPCVQTKSPVPSYSTNYVNNYNGSIDCQTVASSTLTCPTQPCSTINRNVDDRIQRQSVTASICSNQDASSQAPSLATDRNNRKSSLRQSRSVTSENTTTGIVKQVKLKKTNKQNKNGKLENEDSKSKVENTRLKKQNEVEQFKNQETSPTSYINATNFDTEDMELTETVNNLIIIGNLPAKKSIDQTSSRCFQIESPTTCSTNSIDVLTVASFNPTSLPSPTSCSTNNSNNLYGNNHLPDADSSEPISLLCVQTKSPVHHVDYNDSIDCLVIASSEPPLPTASCSSNDNLDDLIHCQSVAASVCSDTEASSQVTELSNRKSSLRQRTSVTNENTAVAKQTKMKRTNNPDQSKRMSAPKQTSSATCETAIVVNQVKRKSAKQQNKDENLENEGTELRKASKSKTQQTKLKEPNKIQQLENAEVGDRPQNIYNPKKSVKGIKSLSENLNLMNVITVNGPDNSESVYCKICQMEHSGNCSKKECKGDDYLKTVENDENDVRRPRRDCRKTTYKEPSLIKKLRRP